MVLISAIQMNEFSEGSTGTDGRVDELTFPVDVSHQPRSEQAHANEKDLDLELNLQKENFSAGPSGGSSEDDELVHPVSESRSEAEVEPGPVTCLEPIREANEDDAAGRTHRPVGDREDTDHTVTVEECRTCGSDEGITEPDNLLVKLGCHCRGSLSMMHRKCILQWYGPRMCQGNNYKCELCNAVLHGRIENTVSRALLGQDSGLDILLEAMRMIRRNAVAEATPTHERIEAHDARNAHPDFHQIDIGQITHDPAPRPDHQHDLYRIRVETGPCHGNACLCVVFFLVLGFVGLAIAFT